MSKKKVIILGSGPAGLTAAVYAARANLEPLLLHGPTPYGQLSMTTDVENFPGFPQGIMGPELMEHMEAQAKRFGTEIVQDMITQVSFGSSPFSLTGSSGTKYSADVVIVATGAKPKLLGVPGELELMGYGVSTCATCDGAFFREQVIVVIGGGDSACEEALFLSRFGSKVILVHRRDELRASKIMQDRVLKHSKIELIWNSDLQKIEGDRAKGVTGIKVLNSKTEEVTTLPCAAVFIAIGHIPNTSLFKGVLDMDEGGYLVPKPNSTQTNIPGIFACGDVQDTVFRQAITAAGSGCMAAIETERYLESLETE
jgi:thioredoxin reductase (NADPH)